MAIWNISNKNKLNFKVQVKFKFEVASIKYVTLANNRTYIELRTSKFAIQIEIQIELIQGGTCALTVTLKLKLDSRHCLCHRDNCNWN